MSLRTLAFLVLPLAFACQAQAPTEDADAHEVLKNGLVRGHGVGPYEAGATEEFRLLSLGTSPGVRWSASGGALSTSGDRATWKLPPPGVATLTATLQDPSGQDLSYSWDFNIVDPQSDSSRARQALQANPAPVVPAGSLPIGNTGSYCDISYDAAGAIHLGFRDDTHPGLWWGKWNGTAWTIELVDGMGFNTGGQVDTRFQLLVDSSNNPHFAYSLANQGIWYATRSSTGVWTRERVDTNTTQRAADDNFSIAFNPAKSNQPTIAYDSTSTYRRQVVAARTAPGTWTSTMINFPNQTYSQTLAGDLLIDSAGVMYLPYTYDYSTSSAYLGSWDGTTAVALALNSSNNTGGLNATWGSAAWSGAGKLLVRNFSGVFQVTINAGAFASSTFTYSNVELNGSAVGDVAFAGGKPYLLHLHGSNLELTTTAAGNYWSYLQLGTASGSAMPSLAVNASGNASICYQNNGKVYFQ